MTLVLKYGEGCGTLKHSNSHYQKLNIHPNFQLAHLSQIVLSPVSGGQHEKIYIRKNGTNLFTYPTYLTLFVTLDLHYVVTNDQQKVWIS